jgi:putative SOS response-associated peptidase YedK
MCGRYTNTTGVEELNARLRVPIQTTEGTRRYNIAPTEQVLAVVAPHGEPEARLLRLGPDPTMGERRQGRREAPAVTLSDQRAERRSLRHRLHARVDQLQVANGYFEWLAPEHQRRGEPRQPFYFQVDEGETFAFAALWTPAKVAGEWINSVTLLTCEASNPVARRSTTACR